jgi:hypothetical protein
MIKSHIVIFSITLILFISLSSYQNADAAKVVISEGNESEGCSSIGGTWSESESNMICYTSNLVINKGDSIIIDSRSPVILTGTVENNGEIFINNPNGSVLFAGIFNNNEGALLETHGIPGNGMIVPNHPGFQIEIGTINNKGTINNFNGFVMDGKYQRIGANTPDDHMAMMNFGTLNNHGFMAFNTGSIINNQGTINNSGYLSVSTINNEENAVLNNTPKGSLSFDNTLNNNGGIVNEGTFENRSCQGTINNSGTISGNPLTSDECVSDVNRMGNSESINSKNNEESGGGCLIATAAYGTEMAPQVQFLREIRDNTVMSTNSGSSFMTGFNQLYYSFSPTIADMERENPLFKEAVRIILTPMIATLSIMTLAEEGNESEILVLGISAIALNLGIYVAAPAAVGFTTHRYIKSRR